MNERVKVATTTSNLQTGDLVWIKNCETCGGFHRFMLLNHAIWTFGPVWHYYPKMSCAKSLQAVDLEKALAKGDVLTVPLGILPEKNHYADV